MSVRKDITVGPIIVGVLLVIIATVVFVILPGMLQPKIDLRLGDGIFSARVAANEDDRVKGLSGVTELAPNQALLMAYPSESKWGIWMKDMKVPIDIVWLNKDKKVIYIVKNVSPEDSTSVVYEPPTLALYVVELPAGTVDGKAIKTDSTAVFQINTGDIK